MLNEEAEKIARKLVDDMHSKLELSRLEEQKVVEKMLRILKTSELTKCLEHFNISNEESIKSKMIFQTTNSKGGREKSLEDIIETCGYQNGKIRIKIDYDADFEYFLTRIKWI